MSKPVTVALPPNLDLWPGCIIRVTAVSPTTGAGVAGVNVGNISIEADQTGGGDLTASGFVPLLRQT